MKRWHEPSRNSSSPAVVASPTTVDTTTSTIEADADATTSTVEADANAIADVDQVVSDSRDQSSSSKPWIPDLNLTSSDKDDIVSGRLLNDRVVDASLTLIRRDTGVANQSTLLSQTAFLPAEANQDTVQILHDKDHWVTVASSSSGIVYADSLKRNISGHLSKQIKEIFPEKLDNYNKICVKLISCQLQTNCSDCGVFAIANAIEFSQGRSPDMCSYDVPQMRKHLVNIFESKELCSFPKTCVRPAASRVVKI